jgi:hypothetical protein
MSAPITETHRALVEKLGDLLDTEEMIGSSPAEQAAQLIADSEAQAVVAAHAVTAVYAERDQLRNELADETNLHAQTRTVVEFLNTICTDLRNAGGPPFIRSEAIRLLREDQATLRAEVELGEQLQAATEASLKTVTGERDQLRAEITRLDSEKPWLKEANATNADLRAEVDRLNDQLAKAVWDTDVNRANARAERAEAEIKDRAAMMRDVMRERDAAEAELAAEREKLSTLREACGHISYIPRIQSALDKTAPAPAALT